MNQHIKDGKIMPYMKNVKTHDGFFLISGGKIMTIEERFYCPVKFVKKKE
jgi:hypothetical protein